MNKLKKLLETLRIFAEHHPRASDDYNPKKETVKVPVPKKKTPLDKNSSKKR